MKNRFWIINWSLVFLMGLLMFSPAQVKSGDNSVKRLYMNISETEKISVPKGVDDYMTSFAGVAKITQVSEKILLIEAIRAGKTTITIISGDEIFRYHLTTFEGRGAEEAHVNNEFAENGYVHLSARFDKVNKDQLVIDGKTETKEQMESAVQIAKKYTPYVVLKAKVMSESDLEEDVSSPEERDIEKTIEKLANIPGLKVKVKFELRQKETNISESATTGNPVVTSTNTTSSGASTTTTAPLLPSDAGGAEPAPSKGSLEQSTVRQLEGVPAKIFLFGKVKDDLQRAQAIRVARTYCQLVVSFLTVEDPIQIRFQAWVLDVNLTRAKNVGVTWPSSLSYRALQGAFSDSAMTTANALNPAARGASSVGTIFSKMFSDGKNNSPMQNITAGLNTNVDVAVQILETEGVGKVVQAPTIMVTNGQHGYFNSGGQIPIVTTTLTATGSQESVTYQPYGVELYVLPLNLERAGPGGTTEDILTSDGRRTIPTMMEAKQILNPIGRNNFSAPPEIDDSLKMVDENGNIGVRVYVAINDIDSSRATAGSTNAPSFVSKTSYTRAVLRDEQPLVISGIYQKQFSQSDRKVPFFGDIPIIGELFKQKNVANDDVREIVVVLKPVIVRMGTSPQERMVPQPKSNELQQMIHEFEPQISSKAKGVNQPFKGSEDKSKLKADAKASVPSVEQVPLIDVTPASPKAEPMKEVPSIRQEENHSNPGVTETDKKESKVDSVVLPVNAEVKPMNLQDEAPAPSVSSSDEKASLDTKTDQNSDDSPARMKEGPKSRVRPEAPDDNGILKDQPQTKAPLLKLYQEARN